MHINHNNNILYFYNLIYFEFTVKMLPGDEIPSTIKFDPYQNAIPYAEYINTNTEPNINENT